DELARRGRQGAGRATRGAAVRAVARGVRAPSLIVWRFEIARFADEALVDGAGDNVPNLLPMLRRGEVLRAGELQSPANVPHAEFGAQPAVGHRPDAAGDETFGAERAPRVELRYAVDVDCGRGGRIDQREAVGAAQIVGENLSDLAGGIGSV